MGFHISWIGFNGVRKADVLDVAGLYDTGEPDEAFEEPFCCAELPTGWTILWANDPAYAEDHIKTLSANHAALSFIVLESAMISQAAFHIRGEQSWRISHDGSLGTPNLTLLGDVPPQTATLHARLFEGHTTRLSEKPRVDYIFDVPVEVAEMIAGFRYDRWRYDWGEPVFTVAAHKTK